MKLTLLLLVFALYAVNAEQERFNRKRWPFVSFVNVLFVNQDWAF